MERGGGDVYSVNFENLYDKFLTGSLNGNENCNQIKTNQKPTCRPCFSQVGHCLYISLSAAS